MEPWGGRVGFVYSSFICVHLRHLRIVYSGITGVFGKTFEFFPQSLVIGIKFYSAFIMVACAGEIAHFVRCVSRVLVDDREILAQAIYDRGIGIGLGEGFLPLRRVRGPASARHFRTA